MLGADRHEGSGARLSFRKASRIRLLTTELGDIPLAIS